MILVIYFLKFKKWWMLQKTEKKSKSQPVETVAERVKLRRQKVDDEDLYDMSQLERYEELNNKEKD